MRRTGLGRHGRIDAEAGDPLDGLVNLFDVGIVLAIAFLVAGFALALEAQGGPPELEGQGGPPERREATREARARPLPAPSGRRARGRGEPVGTVYRLADGRLVVVAGR